MVEQDALRDRFGALTEDLRRTPVDSADVDAVFRRARRRQAVTAGMVAAAAAVVAVLVATIGAGTGQDRGTPAQVVAPPGVPESAMPVGADFSLGGDWLGLADRSWRQRDAVPSALDWRASCSPTVDATRTQVLVSAGQAPADSVVAVTAAVDAGSERAADALAADLGSRIDDCTGVDGRPGPGASSWFHGVRAYDIIDPQGGGARAGQLQVVATFGPLVSVTQLRFFAQDTPPATWMTAIADGQVERLGG